MTDKKWMAYQQFALTIVGAVIIGYHTHWTMGIATYCLVWAMTPPL